MACITTTIREGRLGCKPADQVVLADVECYSPFPPIGRGQPEAWKGETMAEEPQWLPAGQISIHSPQPPNADIEAATWAVPSILADQKSAQDGTISVKAAYLAKWLRDRGHTRAAAEWAILELIKGELLRAKPSGTGWTGADGLSLLHQTRSRPPRPIEPIKISPGRQWKIDDVAIFATAELWEWWHNPAKRQPKSPLMDYVLFLAITHQDLMEWTKRDEEAIRLLTDEQFAAEQERLYATNRLLRAQLGHEGRTPRIWTRRDQKWLEMKRGRRTGYWPVRRTGRYLHNLSRRFDALFRAALDEIRRDGLGAIVGQKLADSREAFEHLYSVAHAFTQNNATAEQVAQAGWKLAPHSAELSHWMKGLEPVCEPPRNGNRPPAWPEGEGDQANDPTAEVHAMISELRNAWAIFEEPGIYDVQEAIDGLWEMLLKVPSIRLPDCPTLLHIDYIERLKHSDDPAVQANERRRWRDFLNALNLAERAICGDRDRDDEVPKQAEARPTSEPTRPKRGRKGRTQEERRRDQLLKADWETAFAADVCKADFCSDRNIKEKHLNRALARLRSDENRANKKHPPDPS